MYTVANETQECVASIHLRISIQYDVGPQYIATPQHHITANVAYCAMYGLAILNLPLPGQ